VSQSEDGCEIVLNYTMKAYGGVDIASLVLNEIVVSRQPHASAALIPRKKPLVPIE
jgi:NAD kinase